MILQEFDGLSALLFEVQGIYISSHIAPDQLFNSTWSNAGLISYLRACMSALWRGSHIPGLIIKYKRGSHGIINMSFLSITGRKELIWICIRKMCVLYFNFWHNWRSRRTIIETIYNFFKFKKVKRWAVTTFCSINFLWLRN